MRARKAVVRRATRETSISADLNIDGSGRCSVETGMPFMNHMIELLTRHSLFDLDLKARGDLDVDYHHTVEDIGLVLGQALNKALGNRKGINRYGWSMIPMDDSMGRAAVDLGGRPYLVYEIANRRRKILDFDLGLVEEFFRAFTVQARMNLHVAHLYGGEPHHAYESVFKAVARALRHACARDSREKGLPSSKGAI
jgi:imidazoleglycerol-phosphate dehydratase